VKTRAHPSSEKQLPGFTEEGKAELEELVVEHQSELKAAKAVFRAEKRTGNGRESTANKGKSAVQAAAAEEAAKGLAAKATAEDRQAQELLVESDHATSVLEKGSPLWRSSMLGLAGLCALLAGVVVRSAHAALGGHSTTVARSEVADEEVPPTQPLLS